MSDLKCGDRSCFRHARAKPQLNPAPQLSSHRRSPPNRPQCQDSCHRCGKDPNHAWNHGECPAIVSTCSSCKKLNHCLQLAINMPAYIRLKLKLSWMVLVLMQPSAWMKPMGKFYGLVLCRLRLHHVVINGSIDRLQRPTL